MKNKQRFTGESWKQLTFELCYTCEKTSQLSYKSRVLHSIWLCALAGVYTRGGAPAILTICLFLYICRQKYVIGDGYYTCVPIRILFQKGVLILWKISCVPFSQFRLGLRYFVPDIEFSYEKNM